MKLSYIILTYNREPWLMRTLDRLPKVTGLPADQWETIVVDNASTDETAASLSSRADDCTVLSLEENVGCAGRNLGAEQAQGDYLCFLDDDSYPQPKCIEQAIEYLDNHPLVGCVGGRIDLPDGSRDGTALPLVPPACGMIVRRDAMLAVGGFPTDFFRQAEEYDLVFKLMQAGFQAKYFEDLRFFHDKSPRARSHSLIMRLDLRNNMVLAGRYLPGRWRRVWRKDWLKRYAALMTEAGIDDQIMPALQDARAMRAQDREQADPSQSLTAINIENAFGLAQQCRAINDWARHHQIKRVVLGQYTKTTAITAWACRTLGVEPIAIADDHPAYQGLETLGLKILPIKQALAMHPQGIVLTNINPAKVWTQIEAWREHWAGPLLCPWQPEYLEQANDPSADQDLSQDAAA